MSARLALAFLTAASVAALGCGAGGRTEVSVTNLVMNVEPDGAIHGGSFELHIARPASASGSSGIHLHTLDILDNSQTGGSGVSVTRLRSEPPGDVDPGEEIVSTIEFELGEGNFAGLAPFDVCSVPAGVVLDAVYLDDAEDAFFRARSPAAWIPSRALVGTTWATTFGDTATQSAHAAALLADGSSIVLGATTDEMGSSTPFVIELDAAGNTVWNQQMALTPAPLSLLRPVDQGPTFVAASPSGGVVVAGILDGSLDMGGNVITSAGDTDIFFARIDAKGKTTETRRFGDALAQSVLAMGVDAAGDVVLAGTLAGAIDFGAGGIGPLISPTVTSCYVAKLPESGAPIYAKVPLAMEAPMDFTAAVGTEGSVILGGTFSGTSWIGAEPPYVSPSITAFLIDLAADGSVAWSRKIDGASVTHVAIDQGDVVAVLEVTVEAMIDGQPLAGGLGGALMLARFDPTGALRYVSPLKSAIPPTISSLVIDSAGHALFAGKLSAPFDLAGATVDPFGRPASFFAEIDRSGAHVRSTTFGCPGAPLEFSDASPKLAVSPTGPRDALLLSSFAGAASFDKGPINSRGAADLFVAKLPAK